MRIRKRVCAVTILSAILLVAILATLAFRTRQENQSGVPGKYLSFRKAQLPAVCVGNIRLPAARGHRKGQTFLQDRIYS